MRQWESVFLGEIELVDDQSHGSQQGRLFYIPCGIALDKVTAVEGDKH